MVSSNQTNQPIRFRKILWISHRGDFTRADENTAEAFRSAWSAGFEACETDLRTSRDGQLILSHDITFERLGGPKVPVWELSANAITKIRLAGGGHPLRWEALMDEFGDRRWTFDIKPEQGDRTVRFLVNLIRASGWESRVELGQYRFLFWSKQHQVKFLEAFPNAHCYARYDECRWVGLAYLFRAGFIQRPQAHKVYALPCRYRNILLFRPEITEYFHKYGAQLCAFLPERGEETEAAISSGYDEILTNYPPVS